SRALEKAHDLVRTVEPLEKRAGQLLQLVRIWRLVDGEVPAGLFREGLRLVAGTRTASREDAARAGVAFRGIGSPRGMAVPLLAEYARADFDEALRLARRLPEARRVAALAQIAQSFGRF